MKASDFKVGFPSKNERWVWENMMQKNNYYDCNLYRELLKPYPPCFDLSHVPGICLKSPISPLLFPIPSLLFPTFVLYWAFPLQWFAKVHGVYDADTWQCRCDERADWLWELSRKLLARTPEEGSSEERAFLFRN